MTSAKRAVRPPLARVRAVLSKQSRLADVIHGLAVRFPSLRDAAQRMALGDSESRYQEWIAAYDTATGMGEFETQRGAPSFAIVVLGEDGGTAQSFGTREVTHIRASDPEEWNAALRLASTEFCLVLESNVALRPHALALFDEAIKESPEADLFYGDEDVVDSQGRRSRHDFKPDWNEALLRSQNYLGGVFCLRRSRALDVGGCEEELDGDCAWGLLLRLTRGAAPGSVRHIPFVLSHRTADGASMRRREPAAVEQRLSRIGEDARAEAVGKGSYLVRYRLDAFPTVTVIVPSLCKPDVLGPCVDGVLRHTSYPDVELVVVANGPPERDDSSRELLRAVAADTRARVLDYPAEPYNFSRLNNWAAEQARGGLLCFLNDDTEVMTGDWLTAMVGESVRARVAAVGALLVSPTGRIQHAGCILGAGGVAAHAYHGRPVGTPGYHERALVAQDVSAVTAACMLVRRDDFFAVGGFDEELAIAYNDVDLCLRLREAGRRVVWTPAASVRHKEGASLRRHYSGDTRARWERESELMVRRWGEQLLADPHYNPNLSLDPWTMWEPAFPPRVRYPWAVTAA